ncbi:MAG: sialate O-acetylesterase [Salinivirgaceae bacterium]
MTLRSIFKLSLLSVALFLVSCTKTTFVEMPALFTDNMVLQQNDTVNIWGKSDPGVKVTVSSSWGNTASCKADATGKWMAQLPSVKAGGPYDLTIASGKITKIFHNILLGEVWICSGQSNMEMPVKGNWAKLNNAQQEVTNANYPEIRLFTVQKNLSFTPIDTMAVDGWVPCDSNTIKNFSATAYFFGRNLYTDLKVPIGLINTSWGGTVAEAWTSKNSLDALPDFAEQAQKISALDASRDSLEKKFEADTKQMFLEIGMADPGIKGTDTLFAAATLNTSDWMPIDLPKLWEETALGNYDGSGWFRCEVLLTPEMANSQLTLCYSAVDDWDEAWVNGVKVGASQVWDVLRKYPIPTGVAKPGLNSITIRIYDNMGGGGFMGEAKDFLITSDKGKSIAIAKGWMAKKGFDFKDIKTIPISMNDPNQPTVLFNAMINPLLPYTIQGAIWYQGESNSGRAYQYRQLFKTMITDWRKHWNQGDFTFLFVQLANYQPQNSEPVEDTWAELREAQTMALELPNTGMAVTIDIGDALDIHPGNKQDVGKRLALNALAKVYQQQIPYSGPMYQSFEVKKNTVEISFTQIYDGLAISGGTKLKGFAIAGADSVFHWAYAVILDNKVVVSSPKVKEPLTVRYGWSINPDCNLVNSSGLPASPFRTDSWKGITE